MTRRMTAWVAALTLAIAGVGVVAQTTSDEEMAERYFAEFQEAAYTEWPFEPGVPDGYYVGTEPHGMVLRSFVNDVAMADLDAGASRFSDGAIIIKENHMPGDVDVSGMTPKQAVEGFEGDLAVLTYMVKVEGYNPDAGDWFWGRQQPDGTIDAAGKVDGCIGCHTGAAGNDYVFNAPLGGG